MSNRFDDVIGAIDALVESDEPAPVRLRPNTLSDDDIDDLVSASLARGPHDDFSAAWGRTVEVEPAPVPTRAPRPSARRSTAAEMCEFCGMSWHGLPLGDCLGSVPDAPEPTDCYVVTLEVEVVADGIASPREAALLAIREVFTGEVTLTVTDPTYGIHEVDVTL